MKIIPLSEGYFRVSHERIFTQITTEEINIPYADTVVFEVQPFVILLNQEIILLDTGFGFQKDNTLQIIANLTANNIDPNQVTKVLLSHLHHDHMSGILFFNNATNKYQLSFPNATYYIRLDEFNFALNSDGHHYNKDILIQLKYFEKNIIWLYNDYGQIDNFITYQKTSGHCPNHQVYWIRDQEKIIFFGGDEAPQLSQLQIKYKAKYDFNPAQAAELRAAWKIESINNNWTFLFYHDLKNPIFQF